MLTKIFCFVLSQERRAVGVNGRWRWLAHPLCCLWVPGHRGPAAGKERPAMEGDRAGIATATVLRPLDLSKNQQKELHILLHS